VRHCRRSRPSVPYCYPLPWQHVRKMRVESYGACSWLQSALPSKRGQRPRAASLVARLQPTRGASIRRGRGAVAWASFSASFEGREVRVSEKRIEMDDNNEVPPLFFVNFFSEHPPPAAANKLTPESITRCEWRRKMRHTRYKTSSFEE
jgi:hypothetical protein